MIDDFYETMDGNFKNIASGYNYICYMYNYYMSCITYHFTISYSCKEAAIIIII